MALVQQANMLRSCQCQCFATSIRPVVKVGGLAPMRRLSAPGLAHGRPNQLCTVALPPLGMGQSMMDCVQLARHRTIMRSFLGVGAPEAILVAVVALVVFGPKGLADAAKSLGQTLRAFQPTIREVVEVSNEIKGTLEQELGLDEIREAASLRPTPRPIRTDSSTSGSSTPAEASTSSSSTLQPVTDDLAKQVDPDIELKRAMSEQAAWGGQAPAAAPVSTAAAGAAAAAAEEGKAAAVAGPAKDLSNLSLEDLEAELARRKKSA